MLRLAGVSSGAKTRVTQSGLFSNNFCEGAAVVSIARGLTREEELGVRAECGH